MIPVATQWLQSLGWPEGNRARVLGMSWRPNKGCKFQSTASSMQYHHHNLGKHLALSACINISFNSYCMSHEMSNVIYCKLFPRPRVKYLPRTSRITMMRTSELAPVLETCTLIMRISFCNGGCSSCIF